MLCLCVLCYASPYFSMICFAVTLLCYALLRSALPCAEIFGGCARNMLEFTLDFLLIFIRISDPGVPFSWSFPLFPLAFLSKTQTNPEAGRNLVFSYQFNRLYDHQGFYYVSKTMPFSFAFRWFRWWVGWFASEDRYSGFANTFATTTKAHTSTDTKQKCMVSLFSACRIALSILTLKRSLLSWQWTSLVIWYNETFWRNTTAGWFLQGSLRFQTQQGFQNSVWDQHVQKTNIT